MASSTVRIIIGLWGIYVDTVVLCSSLERSAPLASTIAELCRYGVRALTGSFKRLL